MTELLFIIKIFYNNKMPDDNIFIFVILFILIVGRCMCNRDSFIENYNNDKPVEGLVRLSDEEGGGVQIQALSQTELNQVIIDSLKTNNGITFDVSGKGITEEDAEPTAAWVKLTNSVLTVSGDSEFPYPTIDHHTIVNIISNSKSSSTKCSDILNMGGTTMPMRWGESYLKIPYGKKFTLGDGFLMDVNNVGELVVKKGSVESMKLNETNGLTIQHGKSKLFGAQVPTIAMRQFG